MFNHGRLPSLDDVQQAPRRAFSRDYIGTPSSSADGGMSPETREAVRVHCLLPFIGLSVSPLHGFFPALVYRMHRYVMASSMTINGKWHVVAALGPNRLRLEVEQRQAPGPSRIFSGLSTLTAAFFQARRSVPKCHRSSMGQRSTITIV